eukprot:g10466.t1
MHKTLVLLRISPRVWDAHKTQTHVIRQSPRVWRLFDARDQIVGRLASRIAFYLQGKYKPSWQNSKDQGDNIVVLNAEKIKFTGNKWKVKTYKHHTGWPGGLQEITAEKMREKHPTKVLYHAVHGMLPRNDLRMPRLRRLHVFSGTTHPFQDIFPGVLVEEEAPMLTDEEMWKRAVDVDTKPGEKEKVWGTVYGMTYDEMVAKGYPTWREYLPPKAVAKFDALVKEVEEEGLPPEFTKAAEEFKKEAEDGEAPEMWPLFGQRNDQPDGRPYKAPKAKGPRKLDNPFEPKKKDG